MDKKLDRRQLGVLTAAGLAVATLCAGAAFAFSGTNGSEQPARDTVPVGQLVEVPTSSAPTSSAEPQVVVADPNPKVETAVPNQPAQQPAPQTVRQPAPANEPVTPTVDPAPPTTNPAGEVTSPPPAPTVRCRMDDSDPVNYPNGREICETVTPAP